MSIELVEVTVQNLDEVLKLAVSTEQLKFVASNAVSIAQSKFYPAIRTEAVYDGGKMVGFVMYGFDPDESRYTLIRLMIDRKHQGKGFGRAAAKAVLERLEAVDDCEAVYLSFVPENTVAENLYESIGFVKTGEIDEGEIVMKYGFN